MLSKQGKTIEGIRATVARILETNMTIGEDGQWKDKETLRTRLELLIDLLEERFKF